MKPFPTLSNAVTGLFLLATALGTVAARAQKPKGISALAGVWTLVAADVIHPDGSRGRDYGEHPSGQMIIDPAGDYSVQIYRSERPRFAAGEKQKGTPAEFESAVMGASCHFGKMELDEAASTLIYKIESSSFPNWEGTQQRRRFELVGDELSYRVPPRANGDVPVSVWRRRR